MKVTGKVHLINPEVTVSDKFKKREVIIEVTDDKYPQFINIELHQDRTDIIDPYKIGDEIEVSINLRGRKWTNKEGVDMYFNTIVGWRIEKVGAQGVGPTNQQPSDAPTDDLPF